MKNKFVVLVGPPAIGKSTYTKKALSSLQPIIINRDEVVEQLSNEKGLTYNEYYQRLGDPDLADLREEVEYTVQQQFKKAVENKNNIVVDMTHMNKNSRKKTLKYVASNDYEKVAVVFKFDKIFSLVSFSSRSIFSVGIYCYQYNPLLSYLGLVLII